MQTLTSVRKKTHCPLGFPQDIKWAEAHAFLFLQDSGTMSPQNLRLSGTQARSQHVCKIHSVLWGPITKNKNKIKCRPIKSINLFCDTYPLKKEQCKNNNPWLTFDNTPAINEEQPFKINVTIAFYMAWEKFLPLRKKKTSGSKAQHNEIFIQNNVCP